MFDTRFAMTISAGFPRPLSEREKAVLRFILSVDDERVLPLREQAEFVVATGKCPCGCATIDLELDRSRAKPAVGLSDCRMAIESNGPGSETSAIFSFLLFLDHGWLDSLEIAYLGPVPPAEFPSVDGFDPPVVSCL